MPKGKASTDNKRWERVVDTYYNPTKRHPHYPPHDSLIPPYFGDAPPNIRTELKAKRESEHVELDIGSGVLWCKFCARSICPFFKDGGKEKTLELIRKLTITRTGRVVVDIFNPEHRWVSGAILLSHVGCVSFSNTDQSRNNEPIKQIEYLQDPDFLEIV